MRPRRAVLNLALLASLLAVSACATWESGPAALPAARVCAQPSMSALAADLDQLEAQIDVHGSVVAKQPDVWGQARLTQARQEFEAELAKELDKFGVKLSGSLQRTDQSYLASALALSAALPTGTEAAGLVLNSRTTKTSSPGDPAKAIPAKETNQTETLPAPKPLAPKDLGDPKLLIPDSTPAVPRETLLPKPLPIVGQEQGVQLEPELYLDQKSRYLHHLGELRRINEGDDTADSPGYALALFRIPVSVLPGRTTAEGFGAEITFSLKPHLSDDLLPTTFRNLVMNDLAEQLGYPLTKVLNDPAVASYLATDKVREAQRQLRAELAKIDELFAEQTRQAESAVEAGDWKSLRNMPGSGGRVKLLHPAELMALASLNSAEAQRKMKAAVRQGLDEQCQQEKVDRREFLRRHATDRIRAELDSSIKGVVITPLSNRRSRLPFPPSQAMELYGPEYVYRIGFAAYQAFAKELASKGAVHLPDVQAFLQEELNAAHRLLGSATHAGLWDFCSPALADAIAARRFDVVEKIRAEFHQRLRNQLAGLPPEQVDEAVDFALAPALVWAILVDSALLNTRLVEDMHETAKLKNCPQCNLGWQPFFLPKPPLEACCAFHEYVRCRWPIHVFALDPITQDQNLANVARQRREMQMALALGFVTGNISAQNMTRLARRLEADAETVSLNRTVVSFAHGPNAFGWRFFPRFAPPEEECESDCAIFWRHLCGKKHEKPPFAGHRLEPGPRECVALVILPSFVPQATLQARGQWFSLACPELKVPSHQETLRLSGLLQGVRSCAGQVADADAFRKEELELLLSRAEQIEARMPSQALRVQVPYENTLGGFEMFNTGITDLTPEVVGFYGQPGILGDRETVLFIMGDHFSANHTKILAGGQPVKVELLSRQVLKATFPPGCAAVDGKVEVHVATPYGVSRPLEIPLVLAKPASRPASTTAAPTPGGENAVVPASAK